MFHKAVAPAAAATFTGAALALGAGQASADPPQGGCPPEWSHVPIERFMPEDAGDFHDQNNNGLVCLKWRIEGPFDRTGKVIDDTDDNGDRDDLNPTDASNRNDTANPMDAANPKDASDVTSPSDGSDDSGASDATDGHQAPNSSEATDDGIETKGTRGANDTTTLTGEG
jgi:hypothetical protein